MVNSARTRRSRQGSHIWPAFDGRHSNAGGRVALFLPDQLPGLAAWFRFGAGITESGGAVSQWNDQSGNGRHLKQATGSAQPALQSDGSILFDGSSDFLKCDAFTLSQPETVYILGRQVTWTLSDRWFDGNGNDSGAMRQGDTTPNLMILAASGVAENSNLPTNTYGVMCAVFNGASSLLQVNNTAATTGNAGAGNMSGFTLAARAAGSFFSHIQVKEVILFSVAHDASIRTGTIRYLADIGGVSI